MKQSTIEKLVDALKATGKERFTRNDIIATARKHDLSPEGFLNTSTYRLERGVYGVTPATSSPALVAAASHVAPPALPPSAVMMVAQPKLHVVIDNLIPPRDATYVPFGFFKDLSTIVASKAFYPVLITGMSGNGKTTMIEQICAAQKREAIRVNITIETDEDDLIGGNTLVDGNVVYREGPVVIAMKRGAILIMDEYDRGSTKLMCMQAVLEGKPYFIKKTGETVYPHPGFNIVGTANSKGQGSEDGKYASVQIQDDAALERFAITVEQEYPSPKIEKKIIMKKMAKVEKVDEEFADNLVAWADIIRKTYADGGVDELISTRRLEHIVNAFAMFGDRMKAIKLCTARFNSETKDSFLDLYTKVDATASTDSGEDLINDGGF